MCFYYYFPAMFSSTPPPQKKKKKKKKNRMSRWGLANMINRYIIQVPMFIFLVIFSNVSFWSPKYIS